jgi:hypothetical protein
VLRGPLGLRVLHGLCLGTDKVRHKCTIVQVEKWTKIRGVVLYLDMRSLQMTAWSFQKVDKNKLSRSIRIKCNKFIYELLNICLTCRTHYSRSGAPLHSVGGPAPLLIISVRCWKGWFHQSEPNTQGHDRRTIYLMSSLSQGMTVRQASGPPQYMRYESSA